VLRTWTPAVVCLAVNDNHRWIEELTFIAQLKPTASASRAQRATSTKNDHRISRDANWCGTIALGYDSEYWGNFDAHANGRIFELAR
jgi:hypothetical protein